MTPRTPLDLNAWRLSVLIPVYNERSTIDAVLDLVRASPMRTEIVCVDDCSTDGTRARLEELHAAGLIDRLILQPKNGGKGAAIRAALAASTGDVVLVQDADLEYTPTDWPGLLMPTELSQSLVSAMILKEPPLVWLSLLPVASIV